MEKKIVLFLYFYEITKERYYNYIETRIHDTIINTLKSNEITRGKILYIENSIHFSVVNNNNKFSYKIKNER